MYIDTHYLLQVYYDVLAQDTGCASAADSLACLRALPFPVLKAAVDKTPDFFSYLVRTHV